MKNLLCMALALVLMASLFTGCGCSANVSDHPGGMITEETGSVMPHPTATHETTRPTTRPTETTQSTMPTVTGSDPTTTATTGPNTTR